MADDAVLYTRMEMRLTDAEKKLAKFQSNVDRNMGGIERRTKKAAQNMESSFSSSISKISGMFKSFGAGLFAGVAAGGIAGVVSGFRDVARGVAEIGDAAKIAGVSTKAFQEWKFVAEQARIPVDALTDGLKELSLRADEFAVTGKGSAAEAFQRLGLSPQEVKGRLKDPAELLILLIERTRQLGDTAAGVRLFDELFGGTGGERMVALIDQGEAGIRAQIKAANDFGIVMNDEMIKKAAETDRLFNQITTTVGTRLKAAVVEAAGALQVFINLYDQYQQRLNLSDAGAEIGAMVNGPFAPRAPESSPAAPKTGRLPSGADILRQKLIQQRIDAAFESPEGSLPSDKKQSGPSQAERERQAIKDLISELEEELRLVNATDAAKRAAAASRQAGAAATEDERQKVINLTEAIYQQEEARRRAEEQMLLYRDLTRAGLDDLFSALENGKSFWQSMGDVAVNSLKRIGDTLLDDVLDSLFKVNSAAGGGSFLSGILGVLGGGATKFPSAPGGLYSDGGYTGPGGKYEPAGIVHKGEYVFDADATRRLGVDNLHRLQGYAQGGLVGAPRLPSLSLPSRGGSTSINFAPQIDARGASLEAVARIEKVMEQQKRDFYANVLNSLNKARRARDWP
ncbi:hypothetical protein QTA58_02490 [Neorhizobium sp. CSC1952]|uniref:hypothetical protein n=1 Tax=Neorhizobium sp. CSC1952 TaxID=2978974 RepID=UPI0025A4F6A8|nr:hypothetical protein [Rhizobium sp. CSC1952]WJR67653.1 hypothetical protein QTA58_02490 [Rhizobium sp. CSC1952]